MRYSYCRGSQKSHVEEGGGGGGDGGGGGSGVEVVVVHLFKSEDA